ncbi:MAG: GH3 auxin-responsive promoter family protein [Nitrososphaerales archaeon]
MDEKTLYEQTCSFFEKSFSRQLEFNQTQLQEHLKRWQQTITSKRIAASTERREQVPLTEYYDYQEMIEFGNALQKLVEQNVRGKDELLADYYCRLAGKIKYIVEGALPYELAFVVKTTGSTGNSKWLVHGDLFWENFRLDSIATGILACSETWGKTKYQIGDKGLNVVAPVPYLSGWSIKSVIPYFQPVPPLEVTDNIPDTRRKFYLALKVMEKGEKIVVGGANAATFYMLFRYFTDQTAFFKDLYKSVNVSLIKFYFLYRMIQSLFKSRNIVPILDVFPLKGAMVGGADTKVYCEFFKNTFGFVPLNIYGSSEAGIAFLGTPDDRLNLIPNLRSGYYEFVNDLGEILALNEVKKDEVYELVVSPFGSGLVRYRSGDLFKVVKIRDDGLPIFSCEGRKINVIDIYGYFRLTEGLIAEALAQAGLKNSDKWAVIKQSTPEEHIHFLMEKEWEYSEEEAEKQIFRALINVSDEFAQYIRVFRIKKPSQIIKVEYLKQGAFTRYIIRATKLGLPLGQLKVPKIIPMDRADIFDLIKSV